MEPAHQSCLAMFLKVDHSIVGVRLRINANQVREENTYNANGESASESKNDETKKEGRC
jgi:hypothetical protein